MIILGIETSCDETAVAILEGPDNFSDFIQRDGDLFVPASKVSDLNSRSNLEAPASNSHLPHSGSAPNLKLLSNVVVSQIDIFQAYGGVIPEIAARSHLEAIMPVIHQAILEAEKSSPAFRARNRQSSSSNPNASVSGSSLSSNLATPPLTGIDAIAVTHTPGLLGSLLVGTLTARTLAILHNKPLYAVHHLKSHIYANWLETTKTPQFPLLSLVISGGHTQIIRMTTHNHFEIIGTTYDDAVGECFDKVAKILGLPYPGGPAISNAAKNGDRHKYQFPHPKLDSPLDFSFSGLKTAFLRTVQKLVGVPISHPSSDLKNLLTPEQIADLAASFEQTAVDILLEKMQAALKLHPDTKSIVFAGGVSANGLLREEASNGFSSNILLASEEMYIPDASEASQSMTSTSETGLLEKSIACFFPRSCFSGDNGAMVAAACYFEILSGVTPTDPYSLNILPRSAIN